MSSCNIYLPDDLIPNILSRLPCKSLIRFLCVNKFWYSLITNNDNFRALHRRNFDSTKGDAHWFCLRARYANSPAKSCLYDASFTHDMLQPYHALREEGDVGSRFYDTVGSCNGLICLYLREERLLCLWNPSIRKCKRLDFPWEDPQGSAKYKFTCRFGLGFTEESNDYKVVAIREEKERMKADVYVYSLIKSSWTDIGSKPVDNRYEYRSNSSDCGTFFNGACHWVRSVGMMCFHLDEQNLHIMHLPLMTNPGDTHYIRYQHARVYKGMLSIWNIFDHCTPWLISIWVMQEYGDFNSWAFLHQVSLESSYIAMPFTADKTGRLLLSKQIANDGRVLTAYDPESEQFEELEATDIWELVPYEESLILL